jgi:hypothetical protein
MSANLPFEIQAEIIKRLPPVKSLIRFRSVSKQWKSLIDSSEFITDHSAIQNHPHHLLVRYELDSECKYVSIVDDDTFPHHKYSPILPPTFSTVLMLGCSHGLVCLYGIDRDSVDSKNLIVVWNPSIRKFVGIMVPDGTYFFGFGVCPKTFDPKIVKIKRWAINHGAEVFTLRSGAWRSISVNLPHKLICFSIFLFCSGSTSCNMHLSKQLNLKTMW